MSSPVYWNYKLYSGGVVFQPFYGDAGVDGSGSRESFFIEADFGVVLSVNILLLFHGGADGEIGGGDLFRDKSKILRSHGVEEREQF